MIAKPLDGFGIAVNHSDTKSNIAIPVVGLPNVSQGRTIDIPLPGLSRRVTNLRYYYEKHGIQVAVAQRKRAALAPQQLAPSLLHNGASTLVLGKGGSERGGWWNALVSAIPLIALVAGLVMIDIAQDESVLSEVVEIDAALLTDDLPPAAYADPGFVQFLKTSASTAD